MSRHLSLLTGFSFLRLKSPDLVWYQWIYPAILSLLFWLMVGLLPEPRAFIEEATVIDHSRGLFNVLAGFYLAALAVVATADHPLLDQEMKGRVPKLPYRRGQETGSEEVKRRRFLCCLLGYCALTSLGLSAVGILTEVIFPLLTPRPGWLPYPFNLKSMWVAMYVYAAASVLIATLLGLHYFIDRLHRESGA